MHIVCSCGLVATTTTTTTTSRRRRLQSSQTGLNAWLWRGAKASHRRNVRSGSLRSEAHDRVVQTFAVALDVRARQRLFHSAESALVDHACPADPFASIPCAYVDYVIANSCTQRDCVRVCVVSLFRVFLWHFSEYFAAADVWESFFRSAIPKPQRQHEGPANRRRWPPFRCSSAEHLFVFVRHLRTGAPKWRRHWRLHHSWCIDRHRCGQMELDDCENWRQQFEQTVGADTLDGGLRRNDQSGAECHRDGDHGGDWIESKWHEQRTRYEQIDRRCRWRTGLISSIVEKRKYTTSIGRHISHNTQLTHIEKRVSVIRLLTFGSNHTRFKSDGKWHTFTNMIQMWSTLLMSWIMCNTRCRVALLRPLLHFARKWVWFQHFSRWVRRSSSSNTSDYCIISEQIIAHAELKCNFYVYFYNAESATLKTYFVW